MSVIDKLPLHPKTTWEFVVGYKDEDFYYWGVMFDGVPQSVTVEEVKKNLKENFSIIINIKCLFIERNLDEQLFKENDKEEQKRLFHETYTAFPAMAGDLQEFLKEFIAMDWVNHVFIFDKGEWLHYVNWKPIEQIEF